MKKMPISILLFQLDFKHWSLEPLDTDLNMIQKHM